MKILEIDEERRRLSLSLKRVEGQVLPQRKRRAAAPPTQASEEIGDVPDLGLSEEVFAGPQASGVDACAPPRRTVPPRRPRRRRRAGAARPPAEPRGRGRAPSRAEAAAAEEEPAEPAGEPAADESPRPSRARATEQ